MQQPPSPRVPFFKKGKSRPSTSRKRSPSPIHPAPASKSEVFHPSKKNRANLLSAGTKRTTSQRDDDDDNDNDLDNDKDGPDVKWTASGSHLNTALEIIAGDEVDAILAKRARKDLADAADDENDRPDDGQYRGQQAYKSHLKKSKDLPKAMRVGPQRNTSTIRTVTIVDYQPDVCKDYKETGYCGFGDTCKFLHDRGTYLAGWQLDNLAANPKKQVEDVSDSDSDEDIPFACLICRKHYTDPVVTRCGHYFCSACAIKRFAKTPKCAACGAPTGGMFNRADKVIQKMAKKKKEEEEEEVEGGDGGGGERVDVEIEGVGGESDEE